MNPTRVVAVIALFAGSLVVAACGSSPTSDPLLNAQVQPKPKPEPAPMPEPKPRPTPAPPDTGDPPPESAPSN
jgi:hypothetical protein